MQAVLVREADRAMHLTSDFGGFAGPDLGSGDGGRRRGTVCRDGMAVLSTATKAARRLVGDGGHLLSDEVA